MGKGERQEAVPLGGHLLLLRLRSLTGLSIYLVASPSLPASVFWILSPATNALALIAVICEGFYFRAKPKVSWVCSAKSQGVAWFGHVEIGMPPDRPARSRWIANSRSTLRQ